LRSKGTSCVAESGLADHTTGGPGAHGVPASVSPFDVLFAEGDYVEPDLVFVRRDRRDIISDRGVAGAPESRSLLKAADQLRWQPVPGRPALELPLEELFGSA
jgi:hypothetical protein